MPPTPTRCDECEFYESLVPGECKAYLAGYGKCTRHAPRPFHATSDSDHAPGLFIVHYPHVHGMRHPCGEASKQAV